MKKGIKRSEKDQREIFDRFLVFKTSYKEELKYRVFLFFVDDFEDKTTLIELNSGFFDGPMSREDIGDISKSYLSNIFLLLTNGHLEKFVDLLGLNDFLRALTVLDLEEFPKKSVKSVYNNLDVMLKSKKKNK